MGSTHARTLTKAAIWESFSWVLTAGVSFAFLGSLSGCTALATVLLIVKVVFLYSYDRAWKKIRWGKIGESS